MSRNQLTRGRPTVRSSLLEQLPQKSWKDPFNWHSHKFDVYTNQPASLSFNQYRNLMRIFFHSGESAIKYPLIISLMWLYWHCENGLEKCEHNTSIESFILMQLYIGMMVLIFNFYCSYRRLQHEEKSIRLTACINQEYLALQSNLILLNNQHEITASIDEIISLADKFSDLHPHQAQTAFTRLFSCHTWSSIAHKTSMFLASALDAIVTFYALKVISAIAYNHIMHKQFKAESLDPFITSMICVVSSIYATLRSRNDIISRSHDSNIHQVSHDLANSANIIKMSSNDSSEIEKRIKARPDLFNPDLLDENQKKIFKCYSSYEVLEQENETPKAATYSTMI